MSEPPNSVRESIAATPPLNPRPRRWRRRLKWSALVLLVLFLAVAYAVKDHVRTLYSLRRVPGTNAYVMDYYVDYHIDEIRQRGIDIHNVEDSFIATLFPHIAPVVRRIKRAYVPQEIKTLPQPGKHCSTFAIRSDSDDVFFGRNLDFFNDAFLILRVHDRKGLASIAVIDLAFLNLNRSDLDKTSLLDRFPLLFTPYYLGDGMNRYGVAVSVHTVNPAKPPISPNHPAIIESTLMRLILDYATSADEAVDLVSEFNVYFVVDGMHFMVADAAGNFRIIEFIDGEVRVTAPEGCWQICTNDIVWKKTEAQRDEGCRRYRAGSEEAEKLGGTCNYDDALRVARSMSVAKTMWTTVYDLTNRKARIIYRDRLNAEYSDAIDAKFRSCAPQASASER